MSKIPTFGAVLATTMLWASLAQAGTWHHGRYVPDYGGHYRYLHRDWTYYGYGGGPCRVWNQGHWVWVCR